MYKIKLLLFNLFLSFVACLFFNYLFAQEFRSIKLYRGETQFAVSNRQDLVKKELIKGRWNNRYYSLVYYDRAPDHKNLKFLSNIGAEVIESVAENFLLVRFKEIPPSDFMNISGIKGVCQFPAKEKISQKLNEVFIASSDQRVLRISVLLYSSEDVAFSSKQLTQLGFVSTNNQYNNKCLFIGDIPKNKILDIASLPCVKYVGLFDYEPKPLLFRENGALGLPNLRNDIFGKGLSGKDVTVGIGDDGDPTSHLDNRFNNSNRNPMPINFSAHGTSVTGIVSSDGIIDERFTGVAPQSSTVTDFFDLIIAKTETYAKDFRMTVTNNSYYNAYDRCIGNSEYNELSVYADDQILALDTVQHIFAAGNDGELTCSPYPAGFGTIKSGYQTAKNILSVGNYAFSFNPRIIASTSSRGPVADGRLKPEIVAPGDAIFSTTLNNGYSNQHWGTSFAAPFVAGTWSFLTEQYRKLNNGKTPPSGLLKSIICNSASDKGNTGPDFSHGFGLLNPTRALQVIDKNQYAEDSITTGAQKSYSLAVPADIKQVKIMLYWHDRPGSPISLKALQNDLDLSVIDGSNNYLPWILNSTPTNIQNLASRGLDRINNIEQITIDNPGSNLTVNVFGHVITGSKQKFYLTWDFIKDDLKILRPAGGERLTAGASEVISWDAIDNQNDSLSLEYSLDNGQSWTTITNTNVSRMFIGWSIPANTATSEAKIRLTRIRDGAVAVTPGVFTIVGVPQLTLNTVCDGAVDLSWTQIGNASDYEVLQLKGGEWTRIGITSGSSFSIRGLNKLESYWFTVRARFQGTFGRRAAAKMVTPKLDTPCQNAEFNNDLTIDALLSPANAREFTSSSLGNSESVKIRIKNLDNASSPGTFGVFYQINEGAIIEEQVNVSIPQGAFIVYTFNTKADFSLPGNYNLKVWVKQAGDGRPENDTCTYLIRFLNNSPVSLPYTDNFENTGKDEYLTGSFGLKNIDRFDLFTTTTNGRARTFVNTGMSLEGNRAITLDAAQYIGSLNTNTLMATYNFSTIPLTNDLRFDFLYKNQGQLKLPNSTLWMRGNDTLPWLKAFDMTNSQNELGRVRRGWMNIYDLLNNAGQPLSSSFQLKVEQTGRSSANNGEYYTSIFDLDDGLTIDALRFTNSINDIQMSDIISPTNFLCSDNTASDWVSIKLKNTSSGAIANIPVSYRLNNGTIISENISAIAANTEINYTFQTPISVALTGEDTLDVWVSAPGDNYPVNDSMIGFVFNKRSIVSNFPFLEKFETNDGGWYTSDSYSSWVWGTPNAKTRSTISSAANGNKGWFTTLFGTYNSNEISYLYTQCFDLRSLSNPMLSFSHISEQEKGLDYHLLEYTLDNGLTWQVLGTRNSGTNWYDTSANFWNTSIRRWHVSSADLPKGVSNIRFRFLLSSSSFNQFEGIGIDDFHIFEKVSIYEGNDITISAPVSGNQFADFYSSGQLIASINPLGQNLGQVNVGVFINRDSVRLINGQYYLDRNIVVDPQFEPTDSVMLRFYFTDSEVNRMLFTTNCANCIKLNDAYRAAITKYNGLSEFENGILNDGYGGTYSFTDATKVEVIPFNNGYYAEFKVKSFSEFWINALDLNINQTPLAVNELSDRKKFIVNSLFNTAGQLVINPANQAGVQEMNVRLLNAAGQEIINLYRPYQRTIIDAGSLANGIYFIVITDRSGKYYYRSKVIK